MKYIIIYILSIVLTFELKAQTANVGLTLPPVALLDIEPNNSLLSLAFQSPTEAGRSLQNTAFDNSKWINFSSAVAPGISRFITAQINSGNLPAGVSLNLAIGNVIGGAGSRGTPIPNVSLSNTPTIIINNIGGAYTGNGTGNGYNLTFSLGINNYEMLRNSSTTFSILYTISEN